MFPVANADVPLAVQIKFVICFHASTRKGFRTMHGPLAPCASVHRETLAIAFMFVYFVHRPEAIDRVWVFSNVPFRAFRSSTG